MVLPVGGLTGTPAFSRFTVGLAAREAVNPRVTASTPTRVRLRPFFPCSSSVPFIIGSLIHLLSPRRYPKSNKSKVLIIVFRLQNTLRYDRVFTLQGCSKCLLFSPLRPPARAPSSPSPATIPPAEQASPPISRPSPPTASSAPAQSQPSPCNPPWA